MPDIALSRTAETEDPPRIYTYHFKRCQAVSISATVRNNALTQCGDVASTEFSGRPVCASHKRVLARERNVQRRSVLEHYGLAEEFIPEDRCVIAMSRQYKGFKYHVDETTPEEREAQHRAWLAKYHADIAAVRREAYDEALTEIGIQDTELARLVFNAGYNRGWIEVERHFGGPPMLPPIDYQELSGSDAGDGLGDTAPA